MKNIINSYSSASVYPVKLLQNKVTDEDKKIIPIHVQLNLTNKCNLSCSYCSCENRDRKLEIGYNKAVDIMRKYKQIGCKAVTISGGGEPLLHKEINHIIKYIDHLGISIGLVTNGIALPKLYSYEYIKWIRVSFDDDRRFNIEYERNLDDAVKLSPNVDWAFSYVLSSMPNYEKIQKIIQFANRYNFTHIRLVSNLLDLESVPVMEKVSNYLKDSKVDDSRVIYQGRKIFTKGTEKCLMSLLKPVIDVDGRLYPCCGIQYSAEQPDKKFDKNVSMGDVNEIDSIFNKQRYYNGQQCVKCYYSAYNIVLDYMVREVEHGEFV